MADVESSEQAIQFLRRALRWIFVFYGGNWDAYILIHKIKELESGNEAGSEFWRRTLDRYSPKSPE